jgi:hypothetical protein
MCKRGPGRPPLQFLRDLDCYPMALAHRALGNVAAWGCGELQDLVEHLAAARGIRKPDDRGPGGPVAGVDSEAAEAACQPPNNGDFQCAKALEQIDAALAKLPITELADVYYRLGVLLEDDGYDDGIEFHGPTKQDESRKNWSLQQRDGNQRPQRTKMSVITTKHPTD